MADDTIETKIVATTDEFQEAMQQAAEAAKTSAESIKGAFETITEAFGIALSIEGIKSFIESMAELGEKTQRTMAQLGLSADAVTQLGGMAKLTGLSTEQLSTSLERMTLNIQKSTKDAFNSAAEGLNVIGVNAKSFLALDTEGKFDKLHDAVSKFNPDLNLTTALMAVGGRGMAAMIPLLQVNAERWEEMKEAIKAAQEGLAAAVPGMADTKEKISLMDLSVQSFGARLFTVLKPAIDSAVTGFTKFIQSMDSQSIQTAVTKIGNITIDIIAAIRKFIIELQAAYETLSDMMGKLGTIASVVSTIFGVMTNPVGTVADLYIKLGKAAMGAADESKSAADKAKTSVDEWAQSLKTAFAVAITPQGGASGAAGGGQNARTMNTGGADQQSAAIKEANDAITLAEKVYEQKTKLYTADAAAYKITEDEKFKLQQKALDEEGDTEDDAIEKLEKYRSTMTLAQRQALDDKIKALEQKSDADQLKLTQQHYAAQQKVVEGYVNNIQSSWNSSLQGLLAGTTSFSAAMKKVFADLIIYMIEQIEKKFIFEKATNALTVALFGATETAKTATVVAGETARTSAQETGFLARMTTTVTEAMASIGAAIASVFAELVVFLTPVFGPAAPAAALTLAVGVGATAAALIPKYEQGTPWVPSTGLAMLHRGEAVIPASQNTGGGFGGGASGGGDTFHFHMNGRLMTSEIKAHALTIAKAVMDAKQFNPSLRS